MDDWGGGMLFITSSFSDLTPGTTYYYRGYIKRNGEYAHWTEIKSATTKITYPSAAFVKVEEMNTNLNIHLNVNDWNNEDKFVTGIQYGFSSDLSDGTNKKINRSTDISQDAQWLVQVQVGVPSIRVYYRFYYAPVSDQNNCTYGDILYYDMPDLDPSLLTIKVGEPTTSTASFSGAFGGIFDANSCLWDVTNSKIQFGVICSTSENATIDTPDVVNVVMTAVKGFLNDELQPATATGLAGGTTYYYRSYYKVGETVVYMHSGNFTTLPQLTTVDFARGELYKQDNNTYPVGDVTISFAGVTAGSGNTAYMYMRTGNNHHIKVTAPKAVKSISFKGVNTTAAPCVIRAKSALSDETTDADMITSYTLENTDAADVTLNLTGDATEVWITASARVNFKGNVSVTY